jgi:hypothetical protein
MDQLKHERPSSEMSSLMRCRARACEKSPHQFKDDIVNAQVILFPDDLKRLLPWDGVVTSPADEIT